VLLVLALLAAALYYVYTSGHAAKSYTAALSCGCATRLQAIPWGKLRIPIVALQIITTYIALTGLPLSKYYHTFISWAGLVKLDLGWIVALGCYLQPDFYQQLLIITITPLVIVVLLLCNYARIWYSNRVTAADENRSYKRTTILEETRISHTGLFLGLTFYIYSTISTALFQVHACDSIDDHAKPLMRYLRADYSIQCDTPKHKAYSAYAYVMTVFYVVGTPLLYTILLLRNKQQLINGTGTVSEELVAMKYDAENVDTDNTVDPITVTVSRHGMESLKSTKFLWNSYKPEHYYWEIIECGRRLLLTGALVFIAPGTTAQADAACLLAFLTMIVALYVQPHADPLDGMVYYGGCLNIFLSTFLSSAMKADVSKETQDSQKAFDVILILLNIFVLVATVGHMASIAFRTTGKTKEAAAKLVAGHKNDDGVLMEAAAVSPKH